MRLHRSRAATEAGAPTLLLAGTRMTRGSFTGSRQLKLKFIMLVWYQQCSIESHAHQFYGELLQFATMWMPDHQVP